MQEEFPFGSLDFPGRTTVTVPELAERIGVTDQHIINLIESGELVACNTGRMSLGRAWYRVPLESWHSFLLERMTGEIANNPMQALPTHALKRLFTDIAGRLQIRGEDPRSLLT